MKRGIFLITLLVVLQASTGFCQEAEEANEELMAAEKQLELRHMQLEWHEAEAKSNFHRQMQELELEERRIELEERKAKLKSPGQWKHRRKEGAVPFLLLCFVVHILVAIWVYQDIRKRNAGSGIWIVVAFLTGLLGVLVYAVVRLGDSRQT